MISIKVKTTEIDKAISKAVAKKQTIIMQTALNNLKAATPVDTGRARDGWRIEGNAIVNDVEYVSDLNAGHSEQAPSLFIERTVLAVDGIVPNGIIVENTR